MKIFSAVHIWGKKHLRWGDTLSLLGESSPKITLERAAGQGTLADCIPWVHAGPHAYIAQMCYTNKHMGFALHSQRTDWPDQNILLLPDRLPEWLSQGHLGKVLQGCIDGVADGLVKNTLHPAHQHLQTFDHGNYLKQKLETNVFATFPLAALLITAS